jgi:S-DNA-T family DNA segregation ATPase FtsK/SpoIIIE
MMNEDSLEDDDELYEAVREEVINSKKASTSYIQRKFGIGYSRAAKLIDTLEARGVVGPANGSKPRDILVGGESPAEEIPAEENNIA